jgi:hypothetical protein
MFGFCTAFANADLRLSRQFVQIASGIIRISSHHPPFYHESDPQPASPSEVISYIFCSCFRFHIFVSALFTYPNLFNK